MLNDSVDGVHSPLPPEKEPFLRRHRGSLIAIAAVLAAVLIIVAFGEYRRKAATALTGPGRGGQDGPVAVSVATVTPGDIEIRIPALGTVTTLANVTVRTQISGTLQKILFKEGQIVREGDVIAQIDPRPYEAALQTAQGNLRRDQALLADAKLDLVRYEGLVKEDSIAAQQLDTQRALVDQYVGTIQSDEGQVKTAQVNLAYTHIVSPVTGRVGIRQVDQGNYVTPGDTNGLVVVNQVAPISVIFSIPEDNVSALMKKVREGGVLKVEAYDRGNAQKLADGVLSTVDNEIDTTTGTVKLRAQFDNADGVLFPNQFVNVFLLQEVLEHQLIMPNSAVRRGAPNGVVSTFVYLVNADGTVAVRPVTLGVVDGERVAVLAGLASGDIVVTAGADRLRDGAKVQIPGAGLPGAGQPGAGLPPAGKPAGGGKHDGTHTPGSHHRPKPAAPQ